MQGCTPKLTHPMYGYSKQDKNNVITVRVSDKINYLTELSTKNYQNITKGTFQSFDSLTLPEDLIRCNEKRCHMSGTLYIKPDGEGVVEASYAIRGDYSQAVFGYHYLYLTYLGEGKREVFVTVSDIRDRAQTNAYTYKTEVTGTGNAIDSFSIAQFDFADPMTITSQNGEGWKGSSEGVFVTYKIVNPDAQDTFLTEPVGISSIKTIACKSELHKSDNVLISCIESFSQEVSVDASDARCFGSGYDPESIEVTTSISGTTRSHNDFWLNPLESKGEKTVAGVPVTRVFKVKAKTVNGTEYGYFEMSDLYPQCNSVIISLGEGCNGMYLEPLQVPQVTPVDTSEFVAISNANAHDFGFAYVNKKYIGQDVLVTYDAETEVTHFVADDSRLNSFEAEFIIPRVSTTGKREYLKFYGIITSHSQEMTSSEEVALSMDVTFVRRDGKFYERFIVA